MRRVNELTKPVRKNFQNVSSVSFDQFGQDEWQQPLSRSFIPLGSLTLLPYLLLMKVRLIL